MPSSPHAVSRASATMNVIECTRYGPPSVLAWARRAIPQPGPDELLVRVLTTTVNSGDWRVRALALPPGFGPLGRLALGLRRPRQAVLGTEFAGSVEAVGARVTRYRPGDLVFGFPGARMGCHAEYLRIAADGPVAAVPPKLSLEQAAALCFGGSTMLDFYRRAALRAGERVLVVGASGTVGTAAVQLAHSRGAHVTAVASGARCALLRGLGVHETIDYAQEDFLAHIGTYDVVVDCVGATPPASMLQVLAPAGRLLLLAAGLPDLLRAPWLGRGRGLRVIAGPVKERASDVRELADLAAQGRFLPVIDRVLPWTSFREAHALVEQRHKAGSIVLRVAAGPALA